MQGDLSVLYALMGVVIFLALLAALGAWVRGGGLKRDEAETLFSDSQERHHEELTRLEKLIEETRLATEQAQAKAEAALAAKLRELDDQVARTETTIQAAVSQAATDQNTALTRELETVSTRIGESEQHMNSTLAEVTNTLRSVQTQVVEAGQHMHSTLLEISRRQQEQKAQSTIQLCEALITSLGTLKSSIYQQLEENAGQPQPVDADTSELSLTAPQFNENDTPEEQLPSSLNQSSAADHADFDEATFGKNNFGGGTSEIHLSDRTPADTTLGTDGGSYNYNTGETREGPFSQDTEKYFRDDDTGPAEENEETPKLDQTDQNDYSASSSNSIEVDQEPRAFNWGDAAISSQEDESRAEHVSSESEEEANRNSF